MSRSTSSPSVSLAVVALLAGALLSGCGGSDEPDKVASEPSPSASASAEAATLELTLPAASAGRCMAPNVENLQAQDTAFEGVVTSATDGSVTLEVDRSFKGEDVQTVTVKTPSADLIDALLAVDFQQGQTYLVSSLDGQVAVCGLSAVKDDLLADLYDRAYAG